METETKLKPVIIIGQPLPDMIKHHIRKNVSTTDFGYVGHLNKVSAGIIDRCLRQDAVPVTDNTYPAIIDLIKLALDRIEEQKKDAAVSKKYLQKIINQ